MSYKLRNVYPTLTLTQTSPLLNFNESSVKFCLFVGKILIFVLISEGNVALSLIVRQLICVTFFLNLRDVFTQGPSGHRFLS